MSATIIMPQLGETVAEGKILTWFKQLGDEVKEGDKLFEVETDKVTIEVEAVAAGKLSDIRVKSGETAKIGTVVAVLGGAAASAPPKQEASPVPARSPFEEVATPTVNFGKAEGPDGLRITPLARRLIFQNGIAPDSLAAFAKSRSLRKIEEKDVRALLGAAPISMARTAPAPFTGGEVVTLNVIRQRTAERLAENWRTIPHVFQAIEVDFTAVDAVRTKRKAAFKTETGASLTYLPFIARAACLAMQAFPLINARFDGTSLTLSKEVSLGIAVDLNHNGLVVPVVRGAGDLTLPGLAKAIGRQIDRARTNKLGADDFAGGTYTITNNGAFGTSFTAPIINAPQVAILSADAIRKKPAVISTAQGDFIAPRLIGMVGQSFDHRAFDGAYSAAFLSKFREIIETRDWTAEFAS